MRLDAAHHVAHRLPMRGGRQLAQLEHITQRDYETGAATVGYLARGREAARIERGFEL